MAAGLPHGAGDLDLYDVACVAWADLDDLVSNVGFGQRDPEKSDKLRQQIMALQRRPGGDTAAVHDFRAELEAAAARRRERESEASDGPVPDTDDDP